MILCLGAVGAGKSTLLKVLQMFGQEDQASFPIPLTTPTVGTDLLTISRIPKSKSGKVMAEERATVREIGGSMAPIWPSYVEAGRTRGILYVVDSSSPESIGASTVRLVELLAHPSLDGVSVLVVFSKADLKGARQLHELRQLMRLDQIVEALGAQHVTQAAFNVDKRDTLQDIFDWCMKFVEPQTTALA